MKFIIKDKKIIEDVWHSLTAEENWQNLAKDQCVIVPLALWQTHADPLLAHFQAGAGVALENTTELTDINQLDQIKLVTIPFPLFTDGRGYSLARLLREEGKFTGEIRAVGDVLQDQLFYLSRCGFDAFDLRDDLDKEKALLAFKTFSRVYQPAWG